MLYSISAAVVCIITISLFLNEFQTAKAVPQRQRFITPNGCKCGSLQCECCAGLDFANSTHHEVCLIFQVIPNEVTVRATVRYDGNNIYRGQLDPSVAPICFPAFPTVCLSINHVDVNRRQVCTKLTLLFFTLIRFPCVGQKNGQLVIQTNNHV